MAAEGRAPDKAAPGGGQGQGQGQGGQGRGRGGGPGARVYVPRPGGRLEAVRFRPGIADDEYTEVLSGALHDGDEIAIDVAGGPQKSGGGSGQQPGGQRGGRGPRFF
jgi:hypothetical protein